MTCPACGHHPPALNSDRLRHALLAAVAPGATDADLDDCVTAAVEPADFDSVETAIIHAVLP